MAAWLRLVWGSQLRSTLVIHVRSARGAWWKSHLQSLLPDLDCRLWDEDYNPANVHYAVVWKPPTGGLKRFANLRCIVSIGAGIDHVLADTELPTNVPIIRTTGDDLTQRMREYVCLHVLRFHRDLPAIESAQAEGRWHNTVNPTAGNRRVGIMGLGKLGADSAQLLSGIGFDVVGWSRTERTMDGITTFAGTDGLNAFLNGTEILVCLLPLTSATRGILNQSLFDELPRGACLINVARGEHLVEADLLSALESGQLGSATLDVFQQEPLPVTHAFWQHPNILVTPHVASMIDPESGGKEIARNLTRFINGEPVDDLVDLQQGY